MRRGRLVLLCLLAFAAACLQPLSARADGDPGSDVLVYQSLFIAPDAGISIAQQVRLDNELSAARRAGMPVRIAIISSPSDLGAITALWHKPQQYARFLGIELSYVYKGRLLVVMPNGFGLNWPGHPTAPGLAAVNGIHTATGGAALATAAEQAVEALAKTDGVRLPRAVTAGPVGAGSVAPGGGSASPGAAGGGLASTVPHASSSTRVLAFAALALLAALVVGIRVLVARRGIELRRRAQRSKRVARRVVRPARPAHGGLRLLRLPVGALAGVAGLAGVVVLAAIAGLAVTHSHTQGGGAVTNASLAANTVLDPGTPISGRAPNFTLTDQSGQPVSLSAFRGRVVVLSFNDSECTTVCPLTTTALLDAKAMLGRAARDVQLLGVDANPRATSIQDVASYSELHGMVGRWDFLTGSLHQLRAVWGAYHIEHDVIHGLVDHTAATFLISPTGRLTKLFITQQSYSAVGQLGQLIAQQAARLLPGHPAVHSHLSYAQIAGVSPTSHVRVPAADGGTPISLGPGRPRLLLFFDTWDRQVTDLAGDLDAMNAYARLAPRAGLPSLTAVDEGAVDPPGALTPFLRSLPRPLHYPVAIDRTGRLADGYEVQGQPWLVLVDRSGQIVWSRSIGDPAWLPLTTITRDVRVSLAKAPTQAPSARLAGSPPKLATLHRQASELLSGGYSALAKRIRALQGYPIVVNVWGSWCAPCQAESGLFATASADYGSQVAFLGADYNDIASNARAFLDEHHVDYPSYAVGVSELDPLVELEGTPTTLFIDRAGKVVETHTGEYLSQGLLDNDIASDVDHR